MLQFYRLEIYDFSPFSILITECFMPDSVKIMSVYSANVSGVWEVSGQGGGFCRVPRSSLGDCIKRLEERNIR